jgi:cell division protein FtsZ
MTDNSSSDNLKFDLPKNQSSVIKVIGVGGGGSNAVNHMFGLGLKGVDFCVCNTDSQALENSPVPNKIQLGVTLTEGLGAGANPEVGEEAAQESIEDIKALLNTNTKMVFITAGMGGGTGTGAAPVIAKAAKDLGILTVGIVTVPFIFEGNNRKIQAEKGVDALRNSVDSLVVINNNKLRQVYGNLGFKAGFAKADEVLATAARGIAEVITHHYTANIDLRDAKTVLANSGTAIMGASTASGENRAMVAINGALDSPLLNDNHIRGAKNVLLLIVSGKEEITIDEIGEINDYIQQEAGGQANIIMGIGENENLGDEIGVTIVATGFNPEQQQSTIGRAPEKVIHTLEDEQEVSSSVYTKPITLDEEEDDSVIEYELAKARDLEAKAEKEKQARLFEQEDSFEDEVEDHPLSETINEEPTPEVKVTGEAPEETRIFTLNDSELDDLEDETTDELSKEETEEAPALEEGPVFEIGGSNEEDLEPRLKDEKPQDEPQKKQESRQEKQEQEPIKRFTLEDYTELEQKLNAASPEAKKEEKPAKSEEKVTDEVEELGFEVRQVGEEKPKAPRKNGLANPVESTIEESMKLKAEERRAQLKAFNYRFKNNPNGIENEPAYKRHGVNINHEKYSSRSNQSRFSIENKDGKTDIKPNNSFLHDNVD